MFGNLAYAALVLFLLGIIGGLMLALFGGAKTAPEAATIVFEKPRDEGAGCATVMLMAVILLVILFALIR